VRFAAAVDAFLTLIFRVETFLMLNFPASAACFRELPSVQLHGMLIVRLLHTPS